MTTDTDLVRAATWYPEIEPYDSGMLDVGDGHRIYWDVSGNPAGKPAVVLHGGPGAGSSPRHRRFFDPSRYRTVVFDQRGCGRSTPGVGDPATELRDNTTWHLVADIERLREHLGVERWLVLGGSWGSTLALAYAETHRERVTELVLTGVCTGRQVEAHWYWGGGAAFLFPEAWERFLAPVPAQRRDGDLVEVFHELLHDPDPAVRHRATLAWDGWDTETLTGQPVPASDLLDPAEFEAAYAAARLCVHYQRHSSWLEEGSLLRNAGVLADLPGTIVQGRFDVQTPMVTAWELARAWKAAELVVVDGAGHSALDPGILSGLITGTDRYAETSPPT